MHPKPSLKFMVLVLLLASLACALSDVASPTPQTQSDLQTSVASGPSKTAAFLTSVAQSVIATEQGTWEARQTVIIEETVTPETGYPLLSVSQSTNCRSGPGSSYVWLGTLEMGVQVRVFARDPLNTYWFIRNPDNPVDFCWIYGAYATLSSAASALPVYTPMPTPAFTPDLVGDFQLIDLPPSPCGMSSYQVRFYITNNGRLTWRSFRFKATDVDMNMTTEIVSNTFREEEDCQSTPLLTDLVPGKSGYLISDSFYGYITGHTMIAEITLCNQNDLQGDCVTRIVEFTIQ